MLNLYANVIFTFFTIFSSPSSSESARVSAAIRKFLKSLSVPFPNPSYTALIKVLNYPVFSLPLCCFLKEQSYIGLIFSRTTFLYNELVCFRNSYRTAPSLLVHTIPCCFCEILEHVF